MGPKHALTATVPRGSVRTRASASHNSAPYALWLQIPTSHQQGHLRRLPLNAAPIPRQSQSRVWEASATQRDVHARSVSNPDSLCHLSRLDFGHAIQSSEKVGTRLA